MCTRSSACAGYGAPGAECFHLPLVGAHVEHANTIGNPGIREHHGFRAAGRSGKRAVVLVMLPSHPDADINPDTVCMKND